MSGRKCRNCGSTDIETDPARGDAVCTECGVVLEDQLIVNETLFEEAPSGNMMVLGQFVGNDSTGGATGFGAAYHVNAKESREITIQNARRGITQLCMQLDLNQHCIDTSVNFYKMALNRNLTRGRRQAHNHAACVYITCRVEGTAHMLIDISDVLQISVHELGRTYLRYTEALCIKIPSMDPCLYIMRFANKLDFGDKTHEVSMTALRIVQRMKRDSIHSGRRPSGLCGAALLMAARLHEFSRSPSDITKIVKVHESTLRKRLIEFGDTPSSALTLEEFMTVDLEEEQDPPAFKAARKKDRERLQKMEDMDTELDDLQSEIDKELESHRAMKGKGRKKNDLTEEDVETETFIKESNLSVIERYRERNLDDPDDPDGPDGPDEELAEPDEIGAVPRAAVESHPLVKGLGPSLASMGLVGLQKDRDNIHGDKIACPYDNAPGDLEASDLDDDELDSYILSEKETMSKDKAWNEINADYLKQQQDKEEKLKREKEEGKPDRKKRRATLKKNKNQSVASTAGEAIEKMLQEKRISSKINYEVLRSLNVRAPSNSLSLGKEETRDRTDLAESKIIDGNDPERHSVDNKKVIKRDQDSIETVSRDKKRKKHNVDEEMHSHVDPAAISDTAEDNEEFADDEAQVNPNEEMSVGQILGQEPTDDDGYEYDYDEDEY